MPDAALHVVEVVLFGAAGAPLSGHVPLARIEPGAAASAWSLVILPTSSTRAARQAAIGDVVKSLVAHHGGSRSAQIAMARRTACRVISLRPRRLAHAVRCAINVQRAQALGIRSVPRVHTANTQIVEKNMPGAGDDHDARRRPSRRIQCS